MSKVIRISSSTEEILDKAMEAAHKHYTEVTGMEIIFKEDDIIRNGIELFLEKMKKIQ